MMLWHYTTRIHLAQIIASRHLRMTPKKPELGQIRGVWFTVSEDWEPTAAKRMKVRDRQTGEETDIGITCFEELEHTMGIARIGVRDGPEYLTFQQYEKICSPEWAAHLVQASISMTREVEWEKPCGPGWWRVCLSEVGALKFRSIQVYDLGRWRDT